MSRKPFEDVGQAGNSTDRYPHNTTSAWASRKSATAEDWAEYREEQEKEQNKEK
jgi:hypothetical protein